MEVPGKKGEVKLVSQDEPPRRDSSLERLAKLSTVYADGICTAGNSSTENDGAAAVVLMSEETAQKAGSDPLGQPDLLRHRRL